MWRPIYFKEPPLPHHLPSPFLINIFIINIIQISLALSLSKLSSHFVCPTIFDFGYKYIYIAGCSYINSVCPADFGVVLSDRASKSLNSIQFSPTINTIIWKRRDSARAIEPHLWARSTKKTTRILHLLLLRPPLKMAPTLLLLLLLILIPRISSPPPPPRKGNSISSAYIYILGW